ncbi:CBO0543 family protein [Ammoniphilus sp. CFH 90114]|uniref:CBO0543 family protein n=1 Tax=Ammoniphilus sp. CFH 90114 TaxID=2493665 RepID=UPI00100F0DE5|nr:CBO0543 family protein [Ammoniphilus sp. CFH 90114]RXT08776.1 hypothetical protein EIZ39_08195 [Ammoniphilus sp. CFH 90114]
MYFIVLFFASWIWFYKKADNSRIRELYGVMIYTSFLALWTDLIMVHYKLWSYHGLPHSKYLIPLLLDFSVYPVVAYLFTQDAPLAWGGIIKRVVGWTFFSVLLEWVTLITGHIQHHKWWTLGFSLVSDILIYLSIWAIYRLYRPAYIHNQLSKRGNFQP